jgi:hypothetical protein
MAIKPVVEKLSLPNTNISAAAATKIKPTINRDFSTSVLLTFGEFDYVYMVSV